MTRSSRRWPSSASRTTSSRLGRRSWWWRSGRSPRFHMTRYHGVLAGRATARAVAVPGRAPPPADAQLALFMRLIPQHDAGAPGPSGERGPNPRNARFGPSRPSPGRSLRLAGRFRHRDSALRRPPAVSAAPISHAAKSYPLGRRRRLTRDARNAPAAPADRVGAGATPGHRAVHPRRRGRAGGRGVARGEARPKSAARRLQVALSSLRQLGLRDVLESVEGGDRLSPEHSIQLRHDP